MKTMALILGLVLSVSSISFADDIADFANKNCVKCHDGNSGFPNLSAQTPDYLFRSLKDYQGGLRHSDNATTLMYKRVQAIDDLTLLGLANYFNQQPAAAPTDGDQALIATGKDIYENGVPAQAVVACIICHGDKAEGLGTSPRLASQLHDFVVEQLQNYKNGLVDNQKRMSTYSSQLSDEQMDAVATYLQSLP